MPEAVDIQVPDSPPEPPVPTGPAEQKARIQALKSAISKGENPFGASAEKPESEGGVVLVEEEPEVPEIFKSVVTVEEAPDSLEGDPEGSYRDDQGRLRDSVSKRFLPDPVKAGGEGGEVPGAVAGGSAAPGEGGEEGEPAGLVFEYARPDRDPIQIPVQSQDQLDTLNHLRKSAMKGAEVRKAFGEIEAREARLEAVNRQLKDDPTGFLLSSIKPENQEPLAVALLREMPPEQFERVIGQLREWEDEPISRREQALRAREERIQREREAEKRTRETQGIEAKKAEIGDAIETLIPDSLSESEGDRMYQYAVTDLNHWIRANDGRWPTPAEVSGILRASGLLERFGAGAPADGGNGAAAPESPAPKPAPAARPAKAAAEEGAIKRARELPEQFRKTTERKRDAAAIAPGGASAGPGAGKTFEPGQHIRDRLKSARKLFGIR